MNLLIEIESCPKSFIITDTDPINEGAVFCVVLTWFVTKFVPAWLRSLIFALFVASHKSILGLPPSSQACCVAVSILANVRACSVPVKSATSEPSPVANEMSEGSALPFVTNVMNVADFLGSEPDFATLRSVIIFSTSLLNSRPFKTFC